MSASLLVILGVSLFAFSSSPSSSNSQTPATTSSVSSGKLELLSGVEVSPQPFGFGDVSMKKGIISQTFSLKNKTGQKLEVAKIETSCMCTEASLKVEDKESPYFGMPGHTANPGWQGTIGKDGEAFLTAKFDPNAHGPQGTGFVKRVLRIFFSSPQNTYLDVNFSANVVP